MTVPDLKSLLARLMNRQDLGPSEMEGLFVGIMDGELEPLVAAAILVALRMKGETGSEVAAAARAMRERAVPVPVAVPERTVDTCGTGGDGASTVNISTATAMVVAAAGVPVAKHGNRSISSCCGSADVLEAAGVRLSLPAEALAVLHRELAVAFLFAPGLHPAMREVMPVRRALGVRTTFNLLGPLTNPAGVRRQVVGVWGREIQPIMAAALADLGAEHALVVHSDDGLDELSARTATEVVEVRAGEVVGSWQARPGELGIETHDDATLRGGDVAHNLKRMRSILSGRERSAAGEAVALNAAAALYVAGAAEDLPAGLGKAREVLYSGAALGLLEDLAARSQELAADA
ncbi:MAG: anthranilate phosphoribosyltransferase [bacterium]|nr:anthranilate phosphoribosyltransferase [bacterium]